MCIPFLWFRISRIIRNSPSVGKVLCRQLTLQLSYFGFPLAQGTREAAYTYSGHRIGLWITSITGASRNTRASCTTCGRSSRESSVYYYLFVLLSVLNVLFDTLIVVLIKHSRWPLYPGCGMVIYGETRIGSSKKRPCSKNSS